MLIVKIYKFYKKILILLINKQNNRSTEDETFFRVIGNSYESAEKIGMTSNLDNNCHIFDARPKINAVGMQLAGKGYENVKFLII